MRRLAAVIVVLTAACLPPTDVFVKAASPQSAGRVAACVARAADSLGYQGPRVDSSGHVAAHIPMPGFPYGLHYSYSRGVPSAPALPDAKWDYLSVLVTPGDNGSATFSVTGSTFVNQQRKFLGEGYPQADTPSDRVTGDVHSVVARCGSPHT